MILSAMETKTLLSFIFVPIFIALFVTLFIAIMVKRSKPDTMIALMYELKLALKELDNQTLTHKQLKTLDMRLSKLQMLADKAGFEDAYDVSVAQGALDAGRKISSALYNADRENCGEYLAMIRDKLAPAAEYLSSVTGIDIENAEIDFKLFSTKAKRDRAEKYLDSIK